MKLRKKLGNLGANLKNVPTLVAKALGLLLIFLIRGLRPFLGPSHCKYPISCTNYAAEQLKTKPLLAAIWLITKRVLSCNPFMDPK